MRETKRVKAIDAIIDVASRRALKGSEPTAGIPVAALKANAKRATQTDAASKRKTTKLKAKIPKKQAPRTRPSGLDCAFEAAKLAQGFTNVVGVDEAGRGPLAGPVVAGACAIPKAMILSDDINGDVDAEGGLHRIVGVDDSKNIPQDERERLYDAITTTPGVEWAVAVLDHEVIDELNILEATMTAMRQCTGEVREKLKSVSSTGQSTLEKQKRGDSPPSSVYVAVDGNRLPAGIDADKGVSAEALVKGDGRVFSIAAASILAKVTRDRIMLEYDKMYPQYGFKDHKGYGVAKHVAAIQRFGPTPIHRKSFQPVKGILGWEREQKEQKEGGRGDEGSSEATRANKAKRGGASAKKSTKKPAAAKRAGKDSKLRGKNRGSESTKASTKGATSKPKDSINSQRRRNPRRSSSSSLS